MGRPLSPSKIGTGVGKLAVQFFDGTSTVTGAIVKQTGANSFIVSADGGTTKFAVKLAQTTSDASSLVAGMATIIFTESDGTTTHFVKKITANHAYTTDSKVLNHNSGNTGHGSLAATAAATSAITVANPGNKTNGTPFAVTGTYSGTAPTKLQYRINTGAYVTATSPTIGSGTYSFNVTLTTQSGITLQVRDFSNNVAGVVSTATASFNVV